MKDREVSLNQKQNMLCSPSVKCAYSSREVNKKTYFQTFGICWPRSNSQTCACNSFPSFPSSPCLTKGHPKFQQKLSRHHKFRDLHKCSIKADLFNIFPLIYVSFCNWFYIKNTPSCASPCATPPHSSFFFCGICYLRYFPAVHFMTPTAPNRVQYSRSKRNCLVARSNTTNELCLFKTNTCLTNNCIQGLLNKKNLNSYASSMYCNKQSTKTTCST